MKKSLFTLVYTVLIFLGLTQPAIAGLPPTSAGISSGATTFKFLFPNFSVTQTGTQISLGIDDVAGGGTGLGALTAHYTLIGNGTGNVKLVAPGASGTALCGNGASSDPSFCSVLTNPMTTVGDTIIGGASGTPTRVANGTTGQVYMATTSSSETWQTVAGNSSIVKSPTTQDFISTGSQTAYFFTVTSATVAASCVFTNNGHTFTTVGATTSSTFLWATGTGAPTASGTLTYSSGTGCNGSANLAFSISQNAATYTLPTNPSPLYLEVYLLGGGGGGGGSGGSAGGGAAGTPSAFGPGLLVATGGQGGGGATSGGTAGGYNLGTFSGRGWSGAVGGYGGQTSVSTVYAIGGIGASSCVGGAGTNGGPVDNGGAALANTGAGGGGAGCTSTASTCNAGGGGGSTGCIQGIVVPASSLPATIYYTIGSGGSGGSAGSAPTGETGGAGATGRLTVIEHYQ